MCAFDFPLRDRLEGELRELGISAEVVLISAEGDSWRCGVRSAGRQFELGYTLADGLWARETTPGQDRHLVSNDHPRLHASDAAWRRGARLISATLRNPAFPPRDPPVI